MDVTILCGLYDTLLDAAGTRARWPDACARLAAARWGGDPQAWAAAQRQAEPAAAAVLQDGIVARAGRGSRQHWHRYFRLLLAEQFALTGVPVPPGLALAAESRRLQAAAAAQAGEPLPGAVAALWALHAAGYRLAAAAELAAPLAGGLLQGCGLTVAFAAVLGPDTLGIARIGPEYYRRACAALRTAPARCIVLDARPLARQWALAAGVAAAFSPAETGWAAVPARLADLTSGWW